MMKSSKVGLGGMGGTALGGADNASCPESRTPGSGSSLHRVRLVPDQRRPVWRCLPGACHATA